MILGILSLVLCCCSGYPGVVLGGVAIALAVISKKQEGSYDSQAKAGLILGIIGAALGLVVVILSWTSAYWMTDDMWRAWEEYLSQYEGY